MGLFIRWILLDIVLGGLLWQIKAGRILGGFVSLFHRIPLGSFLIVQSRIAFFSHQLLLGWRIRRAGVCNGDAPTTATAYRLPSQVR